MPDPMYYLDPPKSLLISQMTSATTTTTMSIPVQTPALKILSITEQLVINKSVLDIKEKGTIFFIMDRINYSFSI